MGEPEEVEAPPVLPLLALTSGRAEFPAHTGLLIEDSYGPARQAQLGTQRPVLQPSVSLSGPGGQGQDEDSSYGLQNRTCSHTRTSNFQILWNPNEF